MPQREPQVRALPVSIRSCVCALALAPPCAHLSRPRRGRCVGPFAASLPEETTVAPRRRERDRRRSDCGAGIAIAARTYGVRPPACLLMCGCILPRCRRSLCSSLGTTQAHRGADVSTEPASCAAADAPSSPSSPLAAATRTVHHDTSTTLCRSLCPVPAWRFLPPSPLCFRACVFGCCCSFARIAACGERASRLCAVLRRDRGLKPL